jgi:hypothetical protein
VDFSESGGVTIGAAQHISVVCTKVFATGIGMSDVAAGIISKRQTKIGTISRFILQQHTSKCKANQ